MAPPPPLPPPSASAETFSSTVQSLLQLSLSTSSTSSSSASSCNMLNYLWIPLLIALSKELSSSADAQSTTSHLLLTSETDAFPNAPRCPTPDPALNYRPVIGILSHPGGGASGRLNNATDASYIAASYVKFVESAGARVIPLVYNEPTEILFEPLSSKVFPCNVEKKLNLVNGVIFTGGWAKSGYYFEIVESIFKNVLRKNDAGEHFPLLAICLGFELLTMIVSKDNGILEEFSAADQASTLQFIENIDINGTLFHKFPTVLLKKLSTECLVMQNHHYGISPGKFKKNKELCSFFKILTTSTDENNEVYVSTDQAYRYPLTALQWHPEKNAFEWGLSKIPHSEDAIQVTQHVANFFVREARKSMNRPPVRKVLDNLIYNYSPTYCGKAGRVHEV